MLHGLTAAIVLKVHHFRGGRSSSRLYNSVVVPSNEQAPNDNEPSSIVVQSRERASERVCHCVSNCLDAAVNSAAQPFQRTKNDRTTDVDPPAVTSGLNPVGSEDRGRLLSPGKKERTREAFQWSSPRIRKCCLEDGERERV